MPRQLRAVDDRPGHDCDLADDRYAPDVHLAQGDPDAVQRQRLQFPVRLLVSLRLAAVDHAPDAHRDYAPPDYDYAWDAQYFHLALRVRHLSAVPQARAWFAQDVVGVVARHQRAAGRHDRDDRADYANADHDRARGERGAWVWVRLQLFLPQKCS